MLIIIIVFLSAGNEGYNSSYLYVISVKPETRRSLRETSIYICFTGIEQMNSIMPCNS